MSLKLVVVVCYTNPSNIVSTIKTITEGQLRPTEIIVAEYGVELPNSLRKKDMVRIVRTPNYGALSSLYAAIDLYGTESNKVHYVLIDGHTQYMNHLAADFLNSAPEIDNNLKGILKEKGLDFAGAIYGLAGLVFTEDKQKSLDDELAALTGGSGTDGSTCPYNKGNNVRDSTPVDVLEFIGGLYVRSAYFVGIKDQLFTKKNINALAPTVEEGAVVLSNYLASRGIYRVQICHLANNRFIMERIGCFSKIPTLHDYSKYTQTIDDLYTKGCLFLCKDRISK